MLRNVRRREDDGLAAVDTVLRDAHAVSSERLHIVLVTERLHDRAHGVSRVLNLGRVGVCNSCDARATCVSVQREHIKLGADASLVLAHLACLLQVVHHAHGEHDDFFPGRCVSSVGGRLLIVAVAGVIDPFRFFIVLLREVLENGSHVEQGCTVHVDVDSRVGVAHDSRFRFAKGDKRCRFLLLPVSVQRAVIVLCFGCKAYVASRPKDLFEGRVLGCSSNRASDV